MSVPIQFVKVQNFKSLKNIDLSCKRINILIGKPNVGKSNLIEALSTFCAPYDFIHYSFTDHNKRIFDSLVRYNQISQLFFFQNINEPITIETNAGKFIIELVENYGTTRFNFICGHDNDTINEIRHEINIKEHIDRVRADVLLRKIQKPIVQPWGVEVSTVGTINTQQFEISNFDCLIKRYIFNNGYQKRSIFNNIVRLYLLPPFGENLPFILNNNHALIDEVAGILEEYNLEMVIEEFTNTIRIHRKIGKRINELPFNLIADTLQRLIFYSTAIASNKNSALLFEEPEAHSFPPYVTALAQKISKDKSNQYFIATHSPYLLTELIENTPSSEVNLFLCKYEDHQTVVKTLSEEEISKILNYGIDIFFNLSDF